MSEKLTELTQVTTLDDTSLIYAVDPTRAVGDKDVSISKTDLASQIGGGGALLPSNNLSDVDNVATSRTNLGLGNVDNTSDLDKPISTATQSEIDNLTTQDISDVPTSRYTNDTDITRLTNTSGTNTGDEDTASIQTKRPLKTVNGESLEGSGNVVISGGGVSSEILEREINAATYTLLEADVDDFRQFHINSSQTNVTITIPQTALTYATDEIKYITIYHEGTGDVTIESGTGVTFTNETFTNVKRITLYSVADDVWEVKRENPSGGSSNAPPFINAYYISDSSGDLESAITATKALDVSESKTHYLIIDQDVNITGSARTINIDVPVIIQRGFKFITPDVPKPITGTVDANYIQLDFKKPFYADRDVQVFEGDGLIWFRNQSVCEEWIDWFGVSYNNNSAQAQSDNVIAMTKAFNSIVLNKTNRATTILRANAGDIYLDSPVVGFACDIDEHPFLTGRRNNDDVVATTIKFYGSEKMKHGVEFGEATVIRYTAKWGAPFMLQGLRNSIFENFKIIGDNNYKSNDNAWITTIYPNTSLTPAQIAIFRPDDGLWDHDVTTTNWINDDIQWEQKKPYSGFIIDPFRTSVSQGKFNLTDTPESTVDPYYGTSQINHQNSWEVNFKYLHISRLVEGITIGLEGQQNDTYVFEEIMFEEIPIGVTFVQNQSRDCKMNHTMAYNDVWSFIDTQAHGTGGVMMETQGGHSAGGLKYFHTGQRDSGIITVDKFYSESIYAVGSDSKTGDYYTGIGINDITNSTEQLGKNNYNISFPATITNSTFKFAEGMKFTMDGADAYYDRPPTIRGFNIISSLIGPYSGTSDANLLFIPFENCNLIGYASGQSTNEYKPADYGWAKNPAVSTLRRTNPIGAVSTNPVPPAVGKRTYGFQSGQPIDRDFNDANFRVSYKYIERSLEQTLEFLRLGQNLTLTYAPNRNYVTMDNVSLSDMVNDGDIMIVEKGSSVMMGVVDGNDGNTTRIAYFNKAEKNELITLLDGSNQVTANIYKVYSNKSFAPFVATKTDNDTFQIVHSAVYRGGTSGKPAQGDYMQMPNGQKVRVKSVSGNTVDIFGSYTATLPAEYITPVYNNVRSYKFVNTGQTTYTSFWEKGEKYDYYSSANIKESGYVECVKSGDFNGTSASTGIYKADFIRYDKDGKIVSYISGSQYVTPVADIDDVTYDFNYSGTKAERPDQIGFPVAFIPNGFVYQNTESGKSERWNGSEFETNNFLGQFTVATLPTGAVGDEATVTDAASVTYRAIATGGGSETVKVIKTSTNWIYN